MPKLYCQNGEHWWERDPQRGKPPNNCPNHRPEKLIYNPRPEGDYVDYSSGVPTIIERKMRTLVCEHDGHSWDAPVQRGRPPRFCPEHRPSEPTIRLSTTHSESAPSQAIQDPALRTAIEAAEAEQRKIELWCQAGEHNWVWERKRGRKPSNCPQHAVMGRIERQGELSEEKKKIEQEKLQEAIVRHSARVEAATAVDQGAMTKLLAAGGAKDADEMIFREWLRANNVLLNEIESLRAKERKLNV